MVYHSDSHSRDGGPTSAVPAVAALAKEGVGHICLNCIYPVVMEGRSLCRPYWLGRTDSGRDGARPSIGAVVNSMHATCPTLDG